MAAACLSWDVLVAASNCVMKCIVLCTTCSCASAFSFFSTPMHSITSWWLLFRSSWTSVNLASRATKRSSRSTRSLAHSAVRAAFSTSMRSFSMKKWLASSFLKATSCCPRSSTCLARFSRCSWSLMRIGPVSASVWARDSSRSFTMSTAIWSVTSSIETPCLSRAAKSATNFFLHAFFRFLRSASYSFEKSRRRSFRAEERRSVSPRISESLSRISLFQSS
mmetsp:Transcript_66251/g.194311  ORF Transcript_66251/g.194311 Transcript_66251/m.194311 type:complete len:222 (+) Transcript_66251:108-773(+)